MGFRRVRVEPVRECSYVGGSTYYLILREELYKKVPVMQTIVKIVCFFISLFVIVNGCYVFYMPPAGDEPVALTIIAVGIIIAILTVYVARVDARSDA